MRYTTVTMIDDRRGFAWTEPLQQHLESYTFSWRNVGNHWGCFTSHGLWDRPPGTMAWCNGSDTRSIEYWVALREVWFDFLAYRVNDFDFESGLDTHVVVQIPDCARRLLRCAVGNMMWLVSSMDAATAWTKMNAWLAATKNRPAALCGQILAQWCCVRLQWDFYDLSCCHGLQLVRHVAFPPQI